MNSPHVCMSMSLVFFHISTCVSSHGAIIARAFAVGIETGPCCEEVEPIGVLEAGTAASQPSSC